MDEKCLEGKVALITGASRGIGSAIASLFAREGAKVVLNYSSEADGSDEAINQVLRDITQTGGTALPYDLDISNLDGHEAMLDFVVARYGQLDILVNNAGVLAEGFTPPELITPGQWDVSQNVNLRGPFFLTQSALEYMKNNDKNEYDLRGNVIFMSSISADYGGMGQHHYCPTKAATNSLVNCFAESQGQYGIRVNGIAPGTIITDINREALEADALAVEKMTSSIPLQRLGSPEDVAGAALFLAYDQMSRYVSGNIVNVNGGWDVVLAGQTR